MKENTIWRIASSPFLRIALLETCVGRLLDQQNPAAVNFRSIRAASIQNLTFLRFIEVSFPSVKFVDADTPFNENKSLSCFAVTIGKAKQKQALKLYKDPVDPKTFWMEVLFLRRLHHPNVANLKGHIFSDNHSGVLVEFSDYGTLFDLLHMDRFKQYRPLPLELQLHFAKDIALGLDYLRSLGVVHKRLKSSNIVVKSLDVAPGHHVILSDFGAGAQEPDHDTRTLLPFLVVVGSHFPSVSFAPTAPITSKFASYFNTLDIYAFGMLLWEIITCELPISYAPKIDTDAVRFLLCVLVRTDSETGDSAVWVACSSTGDSSVVSSRTRKHPQAVLAPRSQSTSFHP